ncbi:Uncharacterised protein [Mycobacterium tuberculosis]|nr:Uncharacterised protein [Mycobacterium tuberculosis]CNM05030.1 Uncharacterised protein [Mycobacterium tuberculosis]CNM11870.1 Uncharacterised protein [Mycobacterium tuberculosis]CNM31711.1 Uncharacterised protein [Mycobacterium tuberculosis]CNM39917.1 Uncharacterised protein [Mycobacterium tuberculosis]
MQVDPAEKGGPGDHGRGRQGTQPGDDTDKQRQQQNKDMRHSDPS